VLRLSTALDGAVNHVVHRLGTLRIRRIAGAITPSSTDNQARPSLLRRAPTALQPQPSSLDAVSFVIMRRHGIQHAFAFDDDFDREGFTRW
jgi:hypothetical protein